jgi:hypothetical protein
MQQNRCIDYYIDGYNQPGQYQLYMPGEPGRIDHGQDILFYEAVGVALLSGTDPEKIFERRQRANPACQFGIHANQA